MGTIDLLYNIEVNIGTILLLFILKFSLYKSNTNLSTDKLLFRYMLDLNLWFSFTDMLTNMFSGASNYLGRVVLTVSKMFNIELMTVISFLWIVYVLLRTKFKNRKLIIWLTSIPLLIATVILLLNPFTDMVFTIDEGNIYHRGWGLIIHWAASWLYVLLGTLFAVIAMKKAPNKIIKRSYVPLIYFIICPSIASVFQIHYYGLSTTQMGLAIGMVLVFCITISGEVSTDKLTLLNNRGGMENFVLNLLENQKFSDVTVLMMDLNNFKSINDRLGHTVGDEALQDAAKVLKKAVSVIKRRVFLCRYGGDEFVIIGGGLNGEEADDIIESIRENAVKKNTENNFRYRLEFSIGKAGGKFESYDDFEKLLKAADVQMYIDKKRLKGIKT